MANEEEVIDFLMHHGVLGQKWGRRKADVTGAKKPVASHVAKKVMTASQREDHEDKVTLITAGVLGGLYGSIKLGGMFISKHPELFTRGMNTLKGTKSIDVGYKVIQLGLKNGRWA